MARCIQRVIFPGYLCDNKFIKSCLFLPIITLLFKLSWWRWFILKDLQVKSQTSSYLGRPPTQKETFSTEHLKTSLLLHFIRKKTYIPHSDFYHNSCLLTTPSPKLESNRFLRLETTPYPACKIKMAVKREGRSC